MSTIDKSRLKNAPLASAGNESDFVAWAMSIPDGAMAAGWQPRPPHLEVKRADARMSKMLPREEGCLGFEVSRRTLARFVELSRRRLGKSLEQFAEMAAVDLAELLAVETGEGVIHPQTVRRLATVLRVNSQRLLHLAGLAPAEEAQFKEAALHFAARTESVRPLDPEEKAALERFCAEALAEKSSHG